VVRQILEFALERFERRSSVGAYNVWWEEGEGDLVACGEYALVNVIFDGPVFKEHSSIVLELDYSTSPFDTLGRFGYFMAGDGVHD